MQKKLSDYVCPETREALFAVEVPEIGDMQVLTSESGRAYRFKNGIVDLTYPETLAENDDYTRSFYDTRAQAYEDNLHLTFDTHGEDETKTRNSFIDKLQLRSTDRVLEIACGTGRDSKLIAERLGSTGELFCQDISPRMLQLCQKKLEKTNIKKHFCISNAMHLPFPDDFFNATYSFGALGEFSDIKRSLAEMVRVTKPGGKIVVGDESIPVWLRDTGFAKILETTNPQFTAELPLEDMPVEAREVVIRFVIGGVFYLIDFKVGQGEPTANFDIPIPGERGGTYRTRFEGMLEGVTSETKKLAYRAVRKKQVDMHSWLDAVVKQAAKDDLENN